MQALDWYIICTFTDGITRNTKGVNICQEWDLLEIAFTEKGLKKMARA